MATASRAIVVSAPRRRSSARRRTRRSGAASPARVRERQQTKTMTLGGISALAFGLVQRKVALPGIAGVPNSLIYGTGAIAVGLMAKSDTLMKIGTGPFFAGLHNIGLKGLTGTQVAGDDSTEGEFDESTAGEFESVVAGDFDDL